MSIFVIITKNPVLSVLFLIGLFLIMSGYLMLLGANFIGLSYILVYVGAVSILFLFILMLINIRVSELISNTSNSLVLAALVVCILLTVFVNISQPILDENITTEFSLSSFTTLISNLIHMYFNHILIKISTAPYWDGNLTDISHISGLGNIIYTNYFFLLILSSFILLLAMIGTIVITITSSLT